MYATSRPKAAGMGSQSERQLEDERVFSIFNIN